MPQMDPEVIDALMDLPIIERHRIACRWVAHAMDTMVALLPDHADVEKIQCGAAEWWAAAGRDDTTNPSGNRPAHRHLHLVQ